MVARNHNGPSLPILPEHRFIPFHLAPHTKGQGSDHLSCKIIVDFQISRGGTPLRHISGNDQKVEWFFSQLADRIF